MRLCIRYFKFWDGKQKDTKTQRNKSGSVFWTFIFIFNQFNVPRGFIERRPLAVVPGSAHIYAKTDADPHTTISDSVERIRFPILDLGRTNTHLIRIWILNVSFTFLFRRRLYDFSHECFPAKLLFPPPTPQSFYF